MPSVEPYSSTTTAMCTLFDGKLPAHGLEVDVDDLPPCLGLGQVGGGETAALLVLLFAGRVCRRKALHLLAQGFQLGIFLGKQTFLLPDLPGVQLHLLAGDGGFVKGARITHTSSKVRQAKALEVRT